MRGRACHHQCLHCLLARVWRARLPTLVNSSLSPSPFQALLRALQGPNFKEFADKVGQCPVCVVPAYLPARPIQSISLHWHVAVSTLLGSSAVLALHFPVLTCRCSLWWLQSHRPSPSSAAFSVQSSTPASHSLA